MTLAEYTAQLWRIEDAELDHRICTFEATLAGRLVPKVRAEFETMLHILRIEKGRRSWQT